MALVYQNGITVNTATGAIVGVGNKTGDGKGNYQNSGAVQESSKPNITVNGQIISGSDPNYDAYKAQQAVQSGQKVASSEIPLGGYVPGGDRSALPAKTEAPELTPDVYKPPVVKEKTEATKTTEATTEQSQKDLEINDLVQSGQVFSENDAKNFATYKNEKDYKKYIGGIGGKENPTYIGATNWAALQKKYTPYQLQQATITTKDGIYWNPAVNIGDIPRSDPALQINQDAKKLADVVSDAKKEADKFTNEDAKKSEDTSLIDDRTENEATIMAMLQDEYGESAEDVYKELYRSPEMKAAQSEVNSLKAQLDEYDGQIEDLKDDIRAEVEGEASDSYISALATIRGDKILKLKRSTQIEYDTALANYNNLKENAQNLLTVRTKDSDNRYNRLFSMLQLQIQQEGTKFSQEVALANIAMNLPENRTITVNGVTYKGLKENDNLNVVQFTDSAHKTYVIGIDKSTGKEVYRKYIGVSSGAGSGSNSAVKDLAEYNATQELAANKAMDAKIAAGTVAIGYDEKGNSFYYDKSAYDAAVEKSKNDWIPWNEDVNKIDYRI